jgi:hypothetical protein
MSYSSFNINPRNLTPEQQRTISIYINQYNQTNNHIHMLLDTLDEIRGNIINVVNAPQPRRTRINRSNRQFNTNNNTGLTRLLNRLFNDRQDYDRNVYYDYNNPINPDIYNEFNMYNNQYNTRNTLSNNIYRNNNYNNNNYNNNNNNNHNNNNNNNNNNYNNYNNNNNNDLSTVLSNFLSSTVVVRPTNDQIENASRIVRYGDIDNPLSQACPISLDEFNDDDQIRQLLYCGHLFHQNQFQEWFENNVRCPVCRYDIRNYSSLSSSSLSSRNNLTNIGSQQSNESQSGATIPPPPNPTENITNDTSSNPDNTNTTPLSNINVIRDPILNQIDHLTFDITNQEFTNSFLDQIARNMFQSMLNPGSQNMNDRFMIDPSNNILFYETIIRRNRESNENNNDDNI